MLEATLILLSSAVSFVLIQIILKSKYFHKHLSTFDEFLAKTTKQHSQRVLTGVGIVFLIAFCLCNIILYYFEINFPNRYPFFIVSLIFITLLSFYDDKNNIDPKLRLIFHLLCVYISIASLNLNLIPLPLKVTMLAAILIWVYILNITNFIDGSDGFCAVNIVVFYFGVIILSTYLNIQIFSYYIGIIIISTLIPFLFYNYPNAKIYMGDTGAIFLGFLVGFSFLEVAILINPLFSIILFIYPLVDCSFTIFKKTLNGHLPWDRLGDYFFLIPKKKCPIKIRKQISLYLFFSIVIFNLINLFLLFFMMYTGNFKLIIINLFLVLILLKLYQTKRVKKFEYFSGLKLVLKFLKL